MLLSGSDRASFLLPAEALNASKPIDLQHFDEKFEGAMIEVLQARQVAADDLVLDGIRLRAAAMSDESSTQVRPISSSPHSVSAFCFQYNK